MKKSSLVRFFPGIVVLLLGIPIVSAIAGFVFPLGKNSLVSVNSAGVQGNGDSWNSDISADGRFVAFASAANNLVDGDVNQETDVFRRDTKTGQNVLISVDSSGRLGNGSSNFPAISADGRFVAFASIADNLVESDTNNEIDVFLHDTKTGKTSLISKSTGGIIGDADSFYPAISADGRYVAFSSNTRNLILNDDNESTDIFLHDIFTGQTTCVSVDSDGILANELSDRATISANGRYVAFMSLADNLATFDFNQMADVFLHDAKTGTTTMITQGNSHSGLPSISGDGRYVAFASNATDLAPGEANGYTADVFVYDAQIGRTDRITSAIFESMYPKISANGRYVAYHCPIANLVTCDPDTCRNTVALYDRQTGDTTLISAKARTEWGNGDSWLPSISADGQRLAYFSMATNLVSKDYNGFADVFLHELPTDEADQQASPGDGSGGGGCFIRAIL